jgi:hypothetical protein
MIETIGISDDGVFPRSSFIYKIFSINPQQEK